MTQSFKKAEEIERIGLTYLFENKLSSKTYSYKLSEVGSYDKFDAYVVGMSKLKNIDGENKRVHYEYVLEAKVRYKKYSTMILEKLKVDNIPDGQFMYYVNFLPDGTYIWKITPERLKDIPIRCELYKKTTMGNTEVIKKLVYHLDLDDAIKVNYILTEAFV